MWSGECWRAAGVSLRVKAFPTKWPRKPFAPQLAWPAAIRIMSEDHWTWTLEEKFPSELGAHESFLNQVLEMLATEVWHEKHAFGIRINRIKDGYEYRYLPLHKFIMITGLFITYISIQCRQSMLSINGNHFDSL